MPAIVSPDELLLGAVVEQVWASMLYRPVLPWTAPWPTGTRGPVASITVAGDWSGTLRLWCTDAAAASMTRSLLKLRPGAEPDAEDVEDALGEVVNVVAGSLKGALGGSSQLGLPQVGSGPAPEPTGDAVHLPVSWHDAPVLISISSAD
jgi:chemotaxis protein CheX